MSCKCLVRRFAVDIVGPKVREMDEKEHMDKSIITGLFEQGVSYLMSRSSTYVLMRLQLMGIETSEEYGGAGGSFTSAIIAIEELAKVDPSVSVVCDVHNTLVNTIFRSYATEEQKQKWLPQLAESRVRIRSFLVLFEDCYLYLCSAVLILSFRARVRLGCVCVTDPCDKGRR